MTKKTETKKQVEPRFVLPGSDRFRIQALAFCYGLMGPIEMFFEQKKEGILPPEASITGNYVFQLVPDGITPEEAGYKTSEILLSKSEQPVTNNAAMFQEEYVKAFVKGFHFGCYAMAYGVLEVLSLIPKDKHYDARFLFSWNLVMPEEDKETDIDQDLKPVLEGLQAIYKQYQSLN